MNALEYGDVEKSVCGKKATVRGGDSRQSLPWKIGKIPCKLLKKNGLNMEAQD